MIPTNKELEILKFYAAYTHKEDKFVWLRKDEKGTYIEYAFKEGAPHDNRCLSWYFSLQPEAIKRNCKSFEHTEEYVLKKIEWEKQELEKKINHLYTLHSFTCGHEEYPESSLKENEKRWNEFYPEKPFIKEDHICKVGCPAPNCIKNKICNNWTYGEPIKCACWNLSEISELPKCVSIPIEDAMKFYNNI